MEQYNVTGMSCAACQARVEKAVSNVPGVESCSVSLLTNSMGVEGTATPDVIIKAVEAAGYGASVKGAKSSSPSMQEQEDALADKTTPVLKKRLAASVIFLVVLMYFSMGHMMWGWPLPAFFDGNHVAMGLIQLMMSPPMFLSSVLNGILIELIVLLLFRGYEKDGAVFCAAMLHTPLSLPFNYLYNRLVKGADSPLAAVADRAPLAAVGMTLAVVAVSALGALIGIKIAKELKKSGVLKK